MISGIALLLAAVSRGACPSIHEAVADDDVDGVKEAVACDGSVLNERGEGGQSPTMAAVLAGRAQVVQALIALGADLTVAEHMGYTPMHGAGFQGRAKIARILHEAGVDTSDYHDDGFTPLHRVRPPQRPHRPPPAECGLQACWGQETRHTETVQMLLSLGVSPSQPSVRPPSPPARCRWPDAGDCRSAARRTGPTARLKRRSRWRAMRTRGPCSRRR